MSLRPALVDEGSGNFFDQYDAPAEANFFDEFDAKPAPAGPPPIAAGAEEVPMPSRFQKRPEETVGPALLKPKVQGLPPEERAGPSPYDQRTTGQNLVGAVRRGFESQVVQPSAANAMDALDRQRRAMDAADAGEIVDPADDLMGYATSDAAARSMIRDSVLQQQGATMGAFQESRRTAQAIPQNPRLRTMAEQIDAGQYAPAARTFLSDPAGITGQVVAESAPSILPQAVLGPASAVMGAGRGARMLWNAIGAYMGDQPARGIEILDDVMRQANVSPDDPDAMMQFIRDNPGVIGNAFRRAGLGSTGLALVSGLTAGASRPLRPAGGVRGNVAPIGVNLGASLVGEPSGEAVAQGITYGEIKSPSDVALEAIGGVPMAGVNTAQETIAAARQPQSSPGLLPPVSRSSPPSAPVGLPPAGVAEAPPLPAAPQPEVSSPQMAGPSAQEAGAAPIPAPPPLPPMPPPPQTLAQIQSEQSVSSPEAARIRQAQEDAFIAWHDENMPGADVVMVAPGDPTPDGAVMRAELQRALQEPDVTTLPPAPTETTAYPAPDVTTPAPDVTEPNAPIYALPPTPVAVEEPEPASPADPPPIPQPSPGSRRRPQRVQQAEDVGQAAARVADPTDAQKAAGNYEKGHITIGPKRDTLDVTIENPAGSERSGTAPDGTRWTSTLGADYGYIKRTKGADGDQVDVFLGPDVGEAAKRPVYVIDQLTTGDVVKFDEHKAMVGFPSEEAARAAYLASFADNVGTDRIGAITKMDWPQFKRWARSGDTAKALSYKPPKIQVKKPSRRKSGPRSLLEFLVEEGGLAPHGDLRAMDAHKRKVFGVSNDPRLVRPKGMSLFEAREKAEDAGYIGAGSRDYNTTDTNDLLAAIAEEMKGRRVFSKKEAGDAESARQEEAGAVEQGRRGAAEVEVNAIALVLGANPSEQETADAVRLVMGGMDAEDALAEVLERAAIQAVEEAVADAPPGSGFDIPFELEVTADEVPAATGDVGQGPETAGREAAEPEPSAPEGDGALGGQRDDRGEGQGQPVADDAGAGDAQPEGEDAGGLATELVDTLDGKREQTLIPGVAPITDEDRKAAAPPPGPAPQQPPGGMFGPVGQTDLVAATSASYGNVAAPDEAALTDAFRKRIAERGDFPSTQQAMRYAGQLLGSPVLPGSRAARTVESALQAARSEEAPFSLAFDREQAITSAGTSVRQVPALFSSAVFEAKPGTVNIDIGGGRFDDATRALEARGVTNLVWDPYNRSQEHNAAVEQRIKGNPADTATVANVLNVIAEPSARATVIRSAATSIKPDGTVYFGIYEGDRSGNGKETPRGWQNNLRAQAYVNEIREAFDNVRRVGNIIVATSPVANDGVRLAIAPRISPQAASLAAGARNQERRGDVRRGAEAMLDRLRMQQNLDRAAAARGMREGRAGVRSVTDPAAIREVDAFIQWLGERMVRDVGLRFSNQQSGAYGMFEVGPRIVTIFRRAIDSDNLDRTMVHELWHAMEAALPSADRAAVRQEYLRARDAWLGKNEWARPFLSGDQILDQLTGDDARAWLDAHPDRADIPVVVDAVDGKPRVRMAWNNETYRFRDRHEYFAETMADRYFQNRDIQDEKARSIFAHIRDIFRRMVAGLKRLFGRDATGRIFDGFDRQEFQPPSAVQQWMRDETMYGALDDIRAVRPDAFASEVRFARAPIAQAAMPMAPTATFNSPPESRLDSFIYEVQNKQIDLKRMQEAIERAGRTIALPQDAYLAEELYHGRTAKRTQDFINEELKPLLQDMVRRGVTMDEMQQFLHARHAEEYNNHIASRDPNRPDGGSGMMTADARAILAGFSPDKIQALSALAQQVDAITRATRRTLVQYGMEPQERIDAWENQFPYYVPLNREDMDTIYGGGAGTGQGYSVRGEFSRPALGSDRDVANIIASIALQRERAIVRGEKNIVANAVIELARRNPNPDIWEVNRPTRIRALENGQVVSRVDPNYKGRDNVIVARSLATSGPGAGRTIIEQTLTLNPENDRAMRMARALKNLDVDDLGHIGTYVAPATRLIASLATQYNPVFGISNIIRDVQEAAINLSSTPLAGKQKEVVANVPSALRGIYTDLRSIRRGGTATNQWGRLWEQFQLLGGQTGFRELWATNQDRAKAIQSEIARVNEGKAKQFGRAVFGWLSDYNEALENSTRLAAFKTALDMGMEPERAASIAKNITVNFNRKGAATTQIAALYAFFNAATQGTTRALKTLAGPAGRKIIAGGVLIGSMQALMLAGAGFSDEDVPEFIREKNLVIPIGGKRYLTIPMPLGFSVFPNIGRISTEIVMDGGKDAGKKAAKLLGIVMGSYNPLGGSSTPLQMIMPTVADPIAAVSENKDFTGRPIARENISSLDPRPGHERKKDVASIWSEYVSRALNTITGGSEFQPGLLSPSPDHIDYLVGQFAGGFVREVNKALTAGVATYRGDDVPPNKIPLVGRFYGNAEGPNAVRTAYFENVKRLNGHEAEIKGRAKAGGDVTGYIAKNPEAGMAIAGNREINAIANMQRARRQMEQQGIPRERLRALDAQIAERMKRFNDMVKQAEKGR